MFILALLVAIPITFYGDWIMELLYGSLYDGAGEILVIHIWSAVFVFLGIAGGRWYVNENLILLSSIRHLLGVIVNIVLNYYWIPLFGIQGAAVATLISYFCSSYIFDLINKKSRPIFYIKSKSIFYFGSSLLLYGIEVFNNKQKNK
jgi:Na+-driven multidrug efflux pump